MAVPKSKSAPFYELSEEREESDSPLRAILSPLRLPKRGVLPGAAIRTSPRSPLPQLAAPQNTPVEEFQKYFTELDILFEYKQLAEHCPKGMFVLQSKKSIREWHGVIFIHSGPFAAGIFRFTVYLTDNFPKSRPILKFTSRVSHPLVNPKTGVFNVSSAFPSWTPHHDHIWNVLAFMKQSFYDKAAWKSQYEEGEGEEGKGETFDEEAFRQEAQQCVKESLQSIHHPKDDDHEHCIVFPVLDDAKFIQARKLIQAGELPQPKEDGESSFFEALQTSVSSLLDKMTI